MQVNTYAPTALTLSPYLSPQQSRCSSDVNHAPERWCYVYTCACGCVRGVGKKKETDRSAWKQGVYNVTLLTHTHRQQRHTIFTSSSASIHDMHSTDVPTRTHTEPRGVSGISVTIATHTHTHKVQYYNWMPAYFSTSIIQKCSSRNSMKVCVQGKDRETQRGTERGRFWEWVV